MKRHNYSSLQEIILAMLDGQVFFDGDYKIWFDQDIGFINNNSNDKSIYWQNGDTWQIKPHWTDKVDRKNAVPCRVTRKGTHGESFVRDIQTFDKALDHIYGDTEGGFWDTAEPVKPEECWQGERR